MTKTIVVVYEKGALRPLEPISCHENERVFLTVETTADAEEDLVDREFHAYCDTQADDSVSLEAVRRALAMIPGSLTDEIRVERANR